MKSNKLLRIERIVIVVVILLSIFGGTVFGYVTVQIKNYSGIENLRKFQPSIPTRLYDINGELIAELFQEMRDLVSFDDLPKNLINAFLAVEDKNFYEHFGIDPISITRAMSKNISASIKNGKLTIVQGGSTITQQLAKRLFTAGDRTFARKALEAILAFQIEKKFSKDEILEMYLNQIFLGHGSYGISAAADFFFQKDVRNLTTAESLLLAALPSKPTGFSPLRFPRAAFFKNKVGVDCGCGNGRYTMVPAGRGAEMVGIDLSNAILAAKEKGKDLPLFHPVQGDIYNLPFPDQQFDFAQTLGVIHITPDPEGALQSIKRTVKATGKIFIYVYRTFEEDSMMKQHALYVANLLRALTIKMSGNVLYLFLYLLIPPIFLLCYLPSMLFWHIPGGRRMFKNFPYNYEQYQNRSFRDIHMNLFDRFGNPIERRYTRREMMDWMEN